MSKLTCKKCILDSDIPGITINEESGLCQFCENYIPMSSEEKKKYLGIIENLLKEHSGIGEYDVIFALSGGKDSSYGLYKLKKEYPFLNILAVQFDNAFISDTAVANAKKMCEIVGCDYYKLTMEEKKLYDTFKKAAGSTNAYSKLAMYRASDICNTCISIIKQKLIEQAIVHKAPFIVFAFTSGQAPNPIIDLQANFIKWSRDIFEKQLQNFGVEDKDEIFLIKNEIIKTINKDATPIMLHPMCLWDYNEEKIVENLIDIGWIPPKISDSNSTNCLLNSFACDNHIKKYQIHPYAFDIAGLVRSGDMTREEGLEKLHKELSKPLIEMAAKKLNMEIE
jgi:tRNA(Ile)-lysidine synthase TilS/MesJ